MSKIKTQAPKVKIEVALTYFHHIWLNNKTRMHKQVVTCILINIGQVTSTVPILQESPYSSLYIHDTTPHYISTTLLFTKLPHHYSSQYFHRNSTYYTFTALLLTTLPLHYISTALLLYIIPQHNSSLYFHGTNLTFISTAMLFTILPQHYSEFTSTALLFTILSNHYYSP